MLKARLSFGLGMYAHAPSSTLCVQMAMGDAHPITYVGTGPCYPLPTFMFFVIAGSAALVTYWMVALAVGM